MVAVVSGNGLGLFATSLTQIGAGLGGGSSIGGSRADQHVNVATGNLILTGWDESLFGHGMATGLVRTYNSQGTFVQAGADGWQTGYERTVRLASGTVNTAGSTVERATADGGVVTYAWDVTRSAYVSTAGDGAHDTITLSAAKWLWTEGSTQVQETYDASTPSTAGKLEKIVDLATNATYDFTYTGAQLTRITGANAETLEFGYDGSNRLVSVGTKEQVNGVLVSKGQVAYGYDGAGRLSWVQTDLTPDNAADNTWDAAVAANNDGKSYRVSYTYADATSLRIIGVSTSDGVTVGYTYDGSGRIASVTQGAAGDGSAQTLTYTYSASETTLTDGAGRSWTYQFDAARQLTAVLDPAVNGQRAVTEYTYDAAGNVTRIRQAAYANAPSALDTVYQYDAKGNVTLQRDQQGNTVARTYTAENRLLTETRYSVVDADGLDPTHVGTTNVPSGAMITRYVYDTTNPRLLRFVISATGEVTETQYNTSGVAQGLASMARRFTAAAYDTGTLQPTEVPTLANMTAWIAGKVAQAARTDYSYDAQGRLSQQTGYASVDALGEGVLDSATSITRYTYDAQGMLRQQLSVHGAGRSLGGSAPSGSEVVDYVYDGLGRLLSTIRRDSSAAANDDAVTVTTTTAYLDSAHKIVTTLDSGMVRTELRNAAGQLVSLSDAGSVAGSMVTRTAQNFYDATGRLRATQDDTGARTYFFYDAAGRLSATVDATGSVTRTHYDAIGRVSGSTTYATLVATTSWFSGGAVTKTALVYAASSPALAGGEAWVQVDTTNDRTATQTYDAAGRLETEVDAAGLTTTYAYDGASRLLSRTLSKPGDASVTPRLERYFYDAADRVIATLDRGGRVVENFYDAGGRLVLVKRYAGPTPGALRATGTLDQLRPPADAQNDQVERYIYDGRGNQVGMVNAEGYFTEFVYDEQANQRAVKAYAKKLTSLTGAETIAQLRIAATTSAPSEPLRLTQRSFNGLGQLLTELNAEGTVTRYSYDEAGRLVRTEMAQGLSDVREDYSRYDVFGQLIGQMSGAQAAVAMAALGNKSLDDPTLTESQLDGVYAQYGVRHSYDLLGRRTESVDASGAKTFYFYDAVGRQTFTVRGVKDGNGIANAQGEVTETRYTTFGQVGEALAYTGRITIAVPGSRASVQSAVNTLSFVAATDTRRQYAYDVRGLQTRMTNAEGVQTAKSYSAFGELYEVTSAYGTAEASTTRYLYNPRGMMNSQTEASGTALARTTILSYDAFGNVLASTDGRGVVTKFTYDRLGRQVSMSRTVSGQVESTSTSYDAFDRVTSQTDARGNTSTYVHSDAARSVVVTTPEGVSFTTVHNRFGETVSVSQALPGGGMATTTTSYDKNGATLSVVDALGNAASSAYDVRGLLTESTDASGRKVQYTYDAVGRVLTRVEDPGVGKLNLTTTYAYDGQGRQLSVTDASGRVTAFSYDREGRLVQMAKDPAGLNLRTVTSYDATGRMLTVTEGFGTAAATTVQYGYDVLNRRVSENVSPGVLNLTTTYAYDAGDNLVTRTDALANITRYAYDENGRLRFEIDATGAVTETGYDTNGNAILSRSYAKALSSGALSSLGAAPTLAAVQALVASESLLNNAADQLAYRVLDRDNRVRFVVDAMGGLTETGYDSAGRVQQTFSYTALFVDATVVAKLRAGTAAVSDFTAFVGTNQGTARASQYIYDVAGRVVYTLLRNDVGQSLVSERRYDASGRAVADVAYAKTIAYTVGQTASQIASAVTAAGGDAANQQRLTRYAYDAAGRLRFTLDDAGAVTETRYDAAGRVASTRVYKTAISVVTSNEAVIATAVATLEDARRTSYVYDAAGRLSSTTDALNNTESYGYDAAGRRTSFTNKLGAIWTYEYDAAGRMTVERSPQVSVARYDADGSVVTSPVSIVTRRTYDALGHVLTVIENADTAEARTITYEYDARGRQVKTIFPDAWQVNSSGVLVATGTQPQVTVAYDALDRAVVQKDVRNNYSYKVYDSQGQLAYDVDEAGYVTAYAYDAFGEQTSVRRYANKIDFTKLSGWSAGTAITLAQMGATGVLTADVAADRILTTTFDALGRKSGVLQSAVSYFKAGASTATTGTPTTLFVYDNYGNLVKERQLLEGTAGQADAVWADTFRYYDELGRLIRSVDAEGYVTGWQYDAIGQMTIQVEFARKIATAGLDAAVLAPLPFTGDATTGYDRSTTWKYDAIGRKSMESVLRLWQTTQFVNTTSLVHTAFAYDAEGRLTSTTVGENLVDGALVNGTLLSGIAYDALGRATSTTEAQRKVLRNDWQSVLLANVGVDLSSASMYVDSAPYTTMEYDAFGNAIRVMRYAAGDPASSNPNSGDASNAITTMRYDKQGRAVITRDAAGTAWYTRYDAADHVVDTWYTLNSNSGDSTVHTLATYDEVGRQVTAETTRTIGANPPVTDASTAVAYNAFGEITAQGETLALLASATTSKRYTYDKAGRMVSSNAETGTNRSFHYNLAGHQVREERPWTNNGSAATAAYITKTDKLGRAVAQILPSWTADANATTQVGFELDRWGNVLRQVDARNNVTEYAYNDRNQAIRQVAPRVKVIDEAGNESWQAPETSWSYDALGRLTATKDANQHVRLYEYDTAGQLVKTIDAAGAVTRQAFDAMGRQLATQNPVGYLSYVDYDKLDRATAQGDFLVAGSARTKTVLQSFLLDQNGNRKQVTDATGRWTKYDYDSRNLLLRSQTASGVVRSYGYDAQGHKTSEVDGLNATNTWDYDAFGRLTDHVDLGGANYDYSYDALSGLLTEASSNRTVLYTPPGGYDPHNPNDPGEFGEPIYLTEEVFDRHTEYYANGQVRRITDGNIYYYYEYDAAGNRTLEETKTVDGRSMVVHTVTRTVYDSNNRISRVTTQDMLAGGAYKLDLSYDYDAVGNRRRVVANSAYGPTSSPLDVVNRAPVAVAQPGNRSVKAGAVVEWALDAATYFTDPDGTPLSYQLKLANGDPIPSWLHMTFDAASGQLRFRADAASSAALGQSFTLRLTATDSPALGSALTVNSTDFTLTMVTNTPPTDATTIPPQTAHATGLAWSYTIPEGVFTDINGDALGYSAIGMPPWMTFDAITRTFSGVPSPVGSWTVTVNATDSSGATTPTTFTVTTANVGPFVSSAVADQVVPGGRAWSFTLPADTFTDRNGQGTLVYSYSVSGSPNWMSFDQATRTITGTPPNSGSWIVTVTASDGSLSASDTFSITIGEVQNRAPVVANAIQDQAIAANQNWSYTLPASTFSDPDGTTLIYSTTALPAWMSFNANTRTFSGVAPATGTWSITVAASDGTLSVGDTFTVSVTPAQNLPPVLVNAIPDQTANATGGVWTYVVPLNTFSDPESSALTYSASNMPGWMSFDAGTRTFSGTPQAVGNWNVTVTVQDAAGATAFDIFQVTTPNVGPGVINAIQDQTVVASQAWSFVMPANTFGDPNGQTLTYTTSTLPAWMSFDSNTRTFSGTAPTTGNWSITVTASDGSSSASDTFNVTIGQPQNAAPQVANPIPDQTAAATGGAWSYAFPANSFNDPEAATLTYTASGMPAWMSFNSGTRTFSGTPSTVGTWNVTVTAQDPLGATVTDTFAVTTPNAAPIVSSAIPDQTANPSQAWSYTFAAGAFTDRNGQTLSYTASGMPAWMSFNAGTRTFSGTAPASGSWSVTVTASDGTLSVTDTFTVAVGAQNQPPVVVTPIPDQTAAATGGAWSYTFPSTSFSDPEAGTLTYSASGMPAWMTFNAGTRTFSGTPSTVGSWNVTVTAQDASGATVTDTFAVSTPNVGPIVSIAIPDQTANPSQVWNYTVALGAFTDSNGQTLTYTASGMPAWMSFNANTRTFTGTAPTSGSWSVTVTASDGTLSVSDTFTVTIGAAQNQPPVLVTPIPDQNAIVAGSPWSYTVPAGTFNDPEGGSLTYSASNMPGWMTFNAATRTFSNLEGLPPASGTYAITVTASDGTLSTSYVFMASITTGQNRAPKLVNPIPDQFVAPNQAWSYVLPADTFRDPDGNALTFSPDSIPAWMSFNPATRTFSGTTPSSGTWSASVSASDGNLFASDGFMVKVLNDAPVVATPIPDQTVYASAGVWSYTIPSGAFSDAEGGALTYSASGMPAWMSFNTATRTFSGTPQAVGNWNITVTVQDPFGATVTDTFVVNTANEAPVITTDIPDLSATAGQPFSYTFPAFTDANGSAVTYTLVGSPPSWLTLNATTRTLSGTPTVAGTYALSVRGSDGSLATLDSFTLTVSANPNNSAPVVSNPLVDKTTLSLNYTFDANTFTDPDGDALTYTYSVSPSLTSGNSLSFNASTRKFTGTRRSSASFVITVTATDTGGNSVSDSFTWGAAGSSLMAGPGSGDLMEAMQATQMQVESDENLQMLPEDPEDPGDPGGGPTLTPNTQTLWFKYDAENRVQVVNGALANGQIVVAAKQANSDVESYALQYDAAGNATTRTTMTAAGVAQVTQSTYNQRGQLDVEYATVNVGATTGIVAKHLYDDAGREIDVTRYFAPETIRTYRTGNPNDPNTEWIDVDISGWKASQTLTTYDQDGRALTVNELGRTPGPWFANADSSTPLTAQSNVLYTTAGGASGYDAAGRLQTYRYEKLTGTTYTHTYTTSYEARDTYLESAVTGTSTNQNYKTTTTHSVYDSAGRRVEIKQTTPITGQPSLTYLRYFSYDANGGILTRRDGNLTSNTFQETANSRKYFAYANGQQVAALGADGKIDAASQLTAFSSSQMGAEPTLVLEGDTLQSIAQRVYGNSSLWYVLAAANAVTDADLVAGTTLKAPQVTTSANDASTFKPYDPNSILGPTTPSLPYIVPPQRPACDALMMVFIVVVAVVVTAVTWGAASTAMTGAVNAAAASSTAATGTAITTGLASTTVGAAAGSASLTVGGAMVAGAAAGAAGAAASGAVGSALGVSSFSWRNVAAGAVTGALTMGLANKFGTVGKALASNHWGKAAALSLANAGASAAGQIVGGGSFSWRSVAANAVSNLVSASISDAVGLKPAEPFRGTGSFGADVANRMIEGVVSLHTRRAFGFEDAINYGSIAADAFGNALGNAVVREIETASTLKSLTPTQLSDYQQMVRDGVPKADALTYAQQTSTALPSYLLRQPLDAEQSHVRLDQLRRMEEVWNSSGRNSHTTQTLPGARAVGANGSFVYDPQLWDLDPQLRGYPVPKFSWVIDSMQHDPAAANAGYDAVFANSLRYAIGAAERGAGIPFDFPGMNASPQALFEYNKEVQSWIYETSARPQRSGDQGAVFALKALAGGVYSYAKAIPEALVGLYAMGAQPGRDVQDMLMHYGTQGRSGTSPEAINERRLRSLQALQNAIRSPISNVAKPWYDTTISAYNSGDGFVYGTRVTDASIAAVTTFTGAGIGTGGRAGLVSREGLSLEKIADSLPNARGASWPVGGSGPAPGVIGISDSTSVRALQNYFPRNGGIEYVYDPTTNLFATGAPRTGLFVGSPHQQLAQSIGAIDNPSLVGGSMRRGPNGEFFTTENSGHYGVKWNDATRTQFQHWFSGRVGRPVIHERWEP